MKGRNSKEDWIPGMNGAGKAWPWLLVNKRVGRGNTNKSPMDRWCKGRCAAKTGLAMWPDRLDAWQSCVCGRVADMQKSGQVPRPTLIGCFVNTMVVTIQRELCTCKLC